jgi:Domain of unknown function (DUF4390)
MLALSRRVLIVLLIAWAVLPQAWAQSSVELRSVRLEQTTDGLYLGANISLELAPTLEDALLKGVALTFVAEAQVLRDRWYWYDKSIATTLRSMRLSYQPLTRRWRLSVSAGSGESSPGASLSQSFDQLSDVLLAVGRISRWRIAEGSDIEPDSRHNVSFRFRLDTNQLPRPMQIGITGNADWNIAVQRSLRPELR